MRAKNSFDVKTVLGYIGCSGILQIVMICEQRNINCSLINYCGVVVRHFLRAISRREKKKKKQLKYFISLSFLDLSTRENGSTKEIKKMTRSIEAGMILAQNGTCKCNKQQKRDRYL